MWSAYRGQQDRADAEKAKRGRWRDRGDEGRSEGKSGGGGGSDSRKRQKGAARSGEQEKGTGVDGATEEESGVQGRRKWPMRAGGPRVVNQKSKWGLELVHILPGAL